VAAPYFEMRDAVMGRVYEEHKCDKARRCSRLDRPLGDRRRDMLQLQRLAHHAHQVLAKPVQVGLLAENAGMIFAM
jgi:hypothetical protein